MEAGFASRVLAALVVWIIDYIKLRVRYVHQLASGSISTVRGEQPGKDLREARKIAAERERRWGEMANWAVTCSVVVRSGRGDE